MKTLYISHHELVWGIACWICIAFWNGSIIQTHTCRALIHLVLVVHILSTIYIAWWLIVVCLCKTVHVVLRGNLKAGKLPSWLHERSTNPLLTRIAICSAFHAFSLHVQISSIHCVALHVWSQVVHLVSWVPWALHQIIIHKICISARHWVLVKRPLVIIDFRALVHDSIWHTNRMSLRICLLVLIANSSLVVLLRGASRCTRKTVP